MQDCELAIAGRYILQMDKKLNVIENGVVLIKDGKIIAIGDQGKLKFEAKKIIDAGNSIVMPGLINTHTHSAMAYFRGLADDLPLNEWLEGHIWPAEGKNVNKNFVRKASELACLEMIKSGTTCFNDMYFFSGETADVAKKIGMRAVVGEAIINFPTPSFNSPEEAIDENLKLIEKFKDDELVDISFAPHSIYTCNEEYLKRVADLAKEKNKILHIHVSETKKEIDDCMEIHKMSPVAYLEGIGFLGENVVSAHSVYLDDKDLDIFKKRNVKVSHNPISNMKLASGIAPATKMIDKKITVSLGTDSTASNNTLDLFEDIKICALLHKVNKLEPTKINAREVITMATINGANALGLDNKIGSLEVGKQADLITINLDKPHLQPIYDPYSHLAYAVRGDDVENVVINGKVVMRNKEVNTIDEEKTLDDAKQFLITN